MGKYLVAFFSAGGSGIGNSGENMEALAKGAKVIGGRRFTSGVSEEEIRSWIDGLDLNVRGYSKIDHIHYPDIMNITDAIFLLRSFSN